MDAKSEPLVEGRTDQRHLVRRRVLLGAKVVEANGAFSTDCMIRNVTDEGAGLRLPAPVPVGEHVYLIELRTGLAHQVKVAWRRNAEMGVEFEKEVVLQPTGDPLTRMLHRLWVGSGNR